MSEMTGPMDPSGMVVSEPGLTGTTNVVAKRVAYTAGDTVIYNRLIVLQTRLDWTDVALEFSFK